MAIMLLDQDKKEPPTQGHNNSPIKPTNDPVNLQSRLFEFMNDNKVE
jgi:hypothetical protein